MTTTGFTGGDDLVVIFKDRTGEDRSPDAVDQLIKELGAVAERHGFKWSTYGTRAQVRQTLHDEQARLDREDLAEMLAEHRRRRAAAEAVGDD